MWKKVAFLACLLLFVFGCKTTEQAIEDYRRCVNDPVCVQEVERSKNVSYSVIKTAGTGFTNNPIVDGLALLLSNALSLGVGIYKGRKMRA